jgi:hypothetical protein
MVLVKRTKCKEKEMPGVQVDRTYYFIIHAYHHVLAKVDAITGKREADVSTVDWVYSSTKSWTEFFRSGPVGEGQTTMHRFPNGSITWEAAFDVTDLPGWQKYLKDRR